jgi:geranylgeranyl pyrophosphate synthase
VEFEASLERYKAIIDSALEEYLSGFRTDAPVLREAMLYAAMGGKRLRGAIVLAVCEELGGDIQDALGLAMAVEMVHAYSLVHDDLPCMDDDDMRRGKPSCHKKYGEALALLCGDALLTAAFEVAATSAGASVPVFSVADSTVSGQPNVSAPEISDPTAPGTANAADPTAPRTANAAEPEIPDPAVHGQPDPTAPGTANAAEPTAPGTANAVASEVTSDRRGPSTGSILGALSTAGRIRAIQVLASAAGADGMVAGQVLDLGLGGDLKAADGVGHMYRLKTGRLFEAAAKMGAIAALASDEAIRVVAPMGGMASTGSDEASSVVTPTGAAGATAPDEPFRSRAAGESINAAPQASTISFGASDEVREASAQAGTITSGVTGEATQDSAQRGAISSGASEEVGKASTRLGTTTFEMSEEVVQAAGCWGLSFGYAFQIADDLDDMDDMEAEAGKTTLAQLTSAQDARKEAVKSLRASLAALFKLPGKPTFLEALSSRYLDSLSARNL